MQRIFKKIVDLLDYSSSGAEDAISKKHAKNADSDLSATFKATLAKSGANTDITSMTGLDDDGIPLAKVDGATGDQDLSGYALKGANSDITSILNAALKLGRDADNKIDFGTDDHLKVTVNGVLYDLTTVLVPATPVAIGETTPNTIRGLNKEVYKVNTAASPLTAAECSGTIVSNYGMTDAGCAITLPAAAEGLAFVCILPAVRAQYFRLNAGAGDKIYLDGVAGTDAEYIGVASGYATGTSISMFCFKASDGSFDWFAIPLFGSWEAE